MQPVELDCDRCARHVKGARGQLFTAGFYDLTADLWKRYARPGERAICDECMWDDPGYRRDYGPRQYDVDGNPRPVGGHAS